LNKSDLIAAAILAARKIGQFNPDPGRVPAN
jgi:hypothetical protein